MKKTTNNYTYKKFDYDLFTALSVTDPYVLLFFSAYKKNISVYYKKKNRKFEKLLALYNKQFLKIFNKKTWNYWKSWQNKKNAKKITIQKKLNILFARSTIIYLLHFHKIYYRKNRAANSKYWHAMDQIIGSIYDYITDSIFILYTPSFLLDLFLMCKRNNIWIKKKKFSIY